MSSSAWADTPLEQPHWRGRWSGVVADLLPWLEAVPEGREVLAAAKKKDPQFLAKIKVGQASFTETSFVRTYSLIDGAEQKKLRHELTLNRALSLGDAVVDLAHELIHATEKGMLDPYSAEFRREDFVRNGIEGPGGELAALERECAVAWALRARFSRYPRHGLCAPYQRKQGGFDREKALSDYYAVGSWLDRLPAEIRALPHISRKQPVLTSSYAKKPYPVALSEEYETTREAACSNNRRKHHLIAAQSEGRSLASVALQEEEKRLRAYERQHCPLEPGGEP